ncbi:hypothetical protein N9J15_06345 [Porticoccaceae bacterium]|nr:hypothetical protein [Porticoccaceae bacterium]
MSAKLIIDEQQLWTSQRSFLMASIGFAVGLGNIWRFPYIVGENGGAAFLIVYLLAAFCIGVPLLIAEVQSLQLLSLDNYSTNARIRS